MGRGDGEAGLHGGEGFGEVGESEVSGGEAVVSF